MRSRWPINWPDRGIVGQQVTRPLAEAASRRRSDSSRSASSRTALRRTPDSVRVPDAHRAELDARLRTIDGGEPGIVA